MLSLFFSQFIPVPTLARALSLVRQMENQIKKDRVFAEALSFRVDQFGNQIIVSTYRHPRAQKKDFKIDALLISHSILKVKQTAITSVKVYFFDSKDNSKFFLATVGKSLLRKLETNRFDKEAVLNQVSLVESVLPNPLKKLKQSSYKEITQANSVSDGILRLERRALLTRIKELKSDGVDVSNLEKVFLKMDDIVRQGDRDIKPLYLYALTLLRAKEKKQISTLELDK